MWTLLYDRGLYSLLEGIFAAEACSLNHCNKADRSQRFDSSEIRLFSFYTVLSSEEEETKMTGRTNTDLQLPLNAPLTVYKQFMHLIWSLAKHKFYEQQHLQKNSNDFNLNIQNKSEGSKL